MTRVSRQPGAGVLYRPDGSVPTETTLAGGGDTLGVRVNDGVLEGVGELDGVAVGEGETEGVAVGDGEMDGETVADCVPVSVDDCERVGERVFEADEPGESVAEHELATARPVVAQPPHGHGTGATEAGGQ